MHTPRLRIALFDVDGTLTAPRDALSARALRSAITEGYGIPEIDLNALRREGLTSREAIIGLAVGHGVSPELAEAGAEAVIRLRDTHYGVLVAADRGAHKLASTAMAPEFVSTLVDARVMLGLVTGNSEFVARTKLVRAGYDSTLFAAGAFGDAPGRREDLAAAVIDRLRAVMASLEPTEVLIVGDAPQDIRAGQAVSARTLAVASGSWSANELADAGPDLLVDDLTPTPALMRHVLGSRSR